MLWGMTENQPAKTYLHHFNEIARRFPDRVAFQLKISSGYRQISYQEVHRLSLIHI